MKALRKGRTAAHTRGGRRTKPQASQGGLVLDDFLAQVAFAQQSFSSCPPNFCLKDVESYPSADRAIERLIRDTVNLHEGQVYTKPDPLLDVVGEKIYEEPVDTGAYSGRRISPSWVGQVLRRVLEIGLQTIVQLPPRDPKSGYSAEKILCLGSALIKLSVRVSGALDAREVLERVQISCAGSHASRMRLMQVGAEMGWAGETLQATARRRVRRIRTGSPNPQVRFAMYFANWVKACTRSQHYALLRTLTEGAFHAAGRTPPKWVDRLEIEMVLQNNYRKKWIRSISS